MKPRKFLVSMGIALSALVSNSIAGKAVRADTKPPESSTESLTPRVVREGVRDLTDPILQKLVYRIENEQHLLLLRKPKTGTIYAGHGSHASHGSHSSHSSGN